MAIVNMRAELESDIEKVWKMVTSLEEYSWRSDLHKIQVLETGRKFIEYDKGGYETTFIITKFEEQKRYEFDLENDNMKGHWTGIFAKGLQDGSTVIDFTEEIIAKKITLKPFVKGFLKKQQQQYLIDLKKALAEK